MGLLEEWAAWGPAKAPFVLGADRAVLLGERSKHPHVTIENWTEAYHSRDFCGPGDHRLHLGLLPQPFCGDLLNASIYILLLNPGLAPHDYFGESEIPEYRTALLRNLSQSFSAEHVPFLFLDPRFAWHSGFGWWNSKLREVVQALSEAQSISFAEARRTVAKQLASIELVPYHSGSFRDQGRWIKDLDSVALARTFVQEVVVPRVERGEAIAIVTRKRAAWALPSHPRVIEYSGAESRAAHLTPKTRGGRAILDELLR